MKADEQQRLYMQKAEEWQAWEEGKQGWYNMRPDEKLRLYKERNQKLYEQRNETAVKCYRWKEYFRSEKAKSETEIEELIIAAEKSQMLAVQRQRYLENRLVEQERKANVESEKIREWWATELAGEKKEMQLQWEREVLELKTGMERERQGWEREREGWEREKLLLCGLKEKN